MYKITCHGPVCRDISLQLRISSGDADLYGKEDSPPQISDSNCNSCTCKSRDSSNFDSCLACSSVGECSKLRLNSLLRPNKIFFKINSCWVIPFVPLKFSLLS